MQWKRNRLVFPFDSGDFFYMKKKKPSCFASASSNLSSRNPKVELTSALSRSLRPSAPSRDNVINTHQAGTPTPWLADPQAGVLHDDDGDTHVTPLGRPDFVKLGLKIWH